MQRNGSRRAVLLGGAYGTLALARSLYRDGVEVWLLAEERRCASWSHAVHRVIAWRGPAGERAGDDLEAIAREHGLAGSLLIPCTDRDVRFVSGEHERLSTQFDVLVPPWARLRWACDKKLASRRASALGIGVPRRLDPAALANPDKFDAGDIDFPLVLKPAMRLADNAFTFARGWRVDDAASLRARYREACALVGADGVLVQQLIPGGGECQLSYAGFWRHGEPLAALTATRLRQYPVEFGSTSTYVVTADHADVRAAAETFLRSIAHHGLVEIEFKRDPRDGELKLLDINPRPWNWFGLAEAAGVDLGAAVAAMAPSPRPAVDLRDARARAGVGWMFVARDVVTASRSGLLRPGKLPAYLASCVRVRKLACFGWRDPVPGVLDLPATLGRMVARRLRRPGVFPTAGAGGVAGDAPVDVVVAGGGLAGSLAAAMLGRAGYRVVLVDPHPVYPPELRCEKLDAAQVATLRRTGLADLVLPSATRDGEAWVARFGRVVDKRPGDQWGILYDRLVNTVRAAIPPHVRFIDGLVTRVTNGQDRQLVQTSTGETVSARLVVLASGLNSSLRHSLGIEREDVSKCHSVTFAFDLAPVGRTAFDFGSLTYYAERTSERVAYVTLFPVGSAMRANLFVYRTMDDPWIRRMRAEPLAAMLGALPGLAKLLGPCEIVGPLKVRPADLYVTRGHLQPGIVLVGDAFATSCPAAGTGADKVLTDVERLCNVHIPAWLASAGMGAEKLASFYADPVKMACDKRSYDEAFIHRATTIDPGLQWRAKRWGRFLLRGAIGGAHAAARGAAAAKVAAMAKALGIAKSVGMAKARP